MLNKEDKIKLIHYRIDQAFDTINVVQVLIQNNMYPAAVNRIYKLRNFINFIHLTCFKVQPLRGCKIMCFIFRGLTPTVIKI